MSKRRENDSAKARQEIKKLQVLNVFSGPVKLVVYWSARENREAVVFRTKRLETKNLGV